MEAKNEIVVYQPNDTLRLDVCLQNDSVWLSQEQMVELFERDRSVISRHIRNAFSEGEVDESNCLHFLQTNRKGRREALYNLDVIISVGYRVKSLRGTQFRKWATQILKDHLLKGFSINARMNQLEDKVDRRLAKNESDIVELKEKVDFFVRTSQPPVQGIFYDGQVFDARVFAAKHILSAKRSIVLIDNWVDIVALELLAKKAKDVSVEIVTTQRGNRLSAGDIATFNAQYGGLTIRTSGNYHDRYLIIDDTRVYLFGASLKDLGKRCFCAVRLEGVDIRELMGRM